MRGVGTRLAAVAAVAIALAELAPGVARAQASVQANVGEFYKGKSITLTVGATPGGGYDAYGRLVARHIGRHLPGQPTVITTNVPGGMGISATNYLYNVAPRDGSAIAILVQNLAEEQIL